VTVLFSGYTAITPLGHVDMVPFLRRMRGVSDEPVPSDEMHAGILALAAAGFPAHLIAHAVDASYETTCEVLAGRRKPRGLGSEKHLKAQELKARRYAERVLVDGRLVHPRCVHGKEKSYQGFGCRCIPCTAAHAAYRRQSRGAAA
jgi:hypothetical protein